MSDDALTRFFVGLSRDDDLWEAFRALAAEHGYEVGGRPRELGDDELESISGGATVKTSMASLTGGGLPDGLSNPGSTSPTPIPFPNVAGGTSDGGVSVDSSGSGTSSSGDGSGTSKNLVTP